MFQPAVQVEVGLEIVSIITAANKWLLRVGGNGTQARMLQSFICKCTRWPLSLQCAIQHMTLLLLLLLLLLLYDNRDLLSQAFSSWYFS